MGSRTCPTCFAHTTALDAVKARAKANVYRAVGENLIYFYRNDGSPECLLEFGEALIARADAIRAREHGT